MPRLRNSANWSLYPELDTRVKALLNSDDLSFVFHETDTAANALEEYDTNVMGFFPCYYHKCAARGWPSKMIAITIRLYRNDEYNARIYHQRCESCGWVARPKLDEHSYAERVAYWLKKWKGISQEVPKYTEKKAKRPHQATLCEGCKNGRCAQGGLQA